MSEGTKRNISVVKDADGNKIVVINLGEFIINSFLLFDVLNIQKNYIRDYNKKNKRAIYFY